MTITYKTPAQKAAETRKRRRCHESWQIAKDCTMLVLTRQRDEIIRIGDKVRLGIDAPKEVPVHRDEVLRAIEREATGRK